MKHPFFGRLFWKLFATFGVATLLGIACTVLLLDSAGPPPALDHAFWLPLVPVSFGLGFCLLAGLAAAWYLSRPLTHLREALRHAADARFEVRVLPQLGHRRDEIVDLAREFDQMAQRLQDASVRQQRLFHDVSHELRSPLARMQAAIGLLQQDHSKAEPAIERIKREVQRLDSLVDELLTLHRLEAGAAAPVRERVDLVELLSAIVEDADFEARARGCSVTLRGAERFVTEVNGELIYRAFENVVRNAVKFTAPDTEVEVDCSVTDEVLRVVVADRGPGVPANRREAIFEPFHRGASPETSGSAQRVPGTGLGLAIAKRALILHGGSIQAEPREQGGLRVICCVPSTRYALR